MTGPRCYTVPQLLEKLQVAKATFYDLKARGRMPFLEELRPRMGRRPRYRADLVDAYLAGTYRRPPLPAGRVRKMKFKRSA